MSIIIYSHGLVSCSVCAPKEMPVELVAHKLNEMNPSGIESSWALAEEKVFRGGQPMPCVCDHDRDRLHYLFHC